jgi:hypothetical protein
MSRLRAFLLSFVLLALLALIPPAGYAREEDRVQVVTYTPVHPILTRIDKDHVSIVYEGSQAHLVFEKIPIRDLILPRWKRQGPPLPNP